MFESLKARFWAWYNRNISAGAVKASSWWANGIGIAIAAAPDAISWVLLNFDLIASTLPTLSLENKARILLAANIAAWVFRLIPQKSVQEAQIKQQANNGLVVPLPPSGVAVAPAEWTDDSMLKPATFETQADSLKRQRVAMERQSADPGPL